MVEVITSSNRNFSLNLCQYDGDSFHSQMFLRLFSFHDKCTQLLQYNFERAVSCCGNLSVDGSLSVGLADQSLKNIKQNNRKKFSICCRNKYGQKQTINVNDVNDLKMLCPFDSSFFYIFVRILGILGVNTVSMLQKFLNF